MDNLIKHLKFSGSNQFSIENNIVKSSEKFKIDISGTTIEFRSPSNSSISINNSNISVSGDFVGGITINGDKIIINGKQVNTNIGNVEIEKEDKDLIESFDLSFLDLKIKKITLSGQVSLDLRKFKNLEKLESINCSGQSSIKVADIAVEDLDIACSGQSNVQINDLKGEILSSNVSGQSTLNILNSKAIKAYFNASGMSTINGNSNNFDKIDKKSSGMSNIYM